MRVLSARDRREIICVIAAIVVYGAIFTFVVYRIGFENFESIQAVVMLAVINYFLLSLIAKVIHVIVQYGR